MATDKILRLEDPMIVVVGNIHDGHTFVGPFWSEKEAEDWIDQDDDTTKEIRVYTKVTLKNPYEEFVVVSDNQAQAS